MKKYMNLGRFFVAVMIFGAFTVGCGPVTANPDGEIPLAPTQDTTTLLSAEPAVPEPEKFDLKPADFDYTVPSVTIGDIPVFLGTGSLKNDAGQVLLINVIGSSEAGVYDYFKNALFYFEITGPVDLPVVNEDTEQSPDLSNSELFKDIAADYLLIDFDLSPETVRDYPRGTLLVIVDPVVRQNQYNNYGTRNPANDLVNVTITVSQNQVEGKLYLRCAAIAGQTKRAWPGIPKTLTGNGAGAFDLTIKGINAGYNKYKLTGAWSYDYTQTVLSEVVTRVTCP